MVTFLQIAVRQGQQGLLRARCKRPAEATAGDAGLRAGQGQLGFEKIQVRTPGGRARARSLQGF